MSDTFISQDIDIEKTLLVTIDLEWTFEVSAEEDHFQNRYKHYRIIPTRIKILNEVGDSGWVCAKFLSENDISDVQLEKMRTEAESFDTLI
tara:strand:- start:230 stop:502 length:273 start_codon:yes stop_codon:yes gene_type:complete